MNIVFLSYRFWPPDFGGELRITGERLTTLAGRGHEVVVLAGGHPGFPRHEVRDGVTILRSPVIGAARPLRVVRRIVFFFWALWFLLRRRFDVLHWLSLPALEHVSAALVAYVFGLVAHGRGARVVTVLPLSKAEDDAIDLARTGSVWGRLQYAQTDAIVAVSLALYAPLRDMFPEKARLILNAIRDDLFQPLTSEARSALRQQHGVTDQQVVFSFMGSVGRRKGFDLIAAAFADLAPDHPDWRLWVIGPTTRQQSPSLDEAETAAVMQPLAGCRDQVRFWGRIDDRETVAQTLGATDVFVFPTRREGMPLSPLEAMSTTLPVIIARIPGVTDIANIEGETGLYVPPDDVAALKGAMRRLGDDAALRAQMGAAARARIVGRFGWQQHVDRWEQLYAHGTVPGDA